MKWLDALKEGATRAAGKAQRTMEMTKMSAYIASKRKRIRTVQEQIGAVVYAAWKAGDFASSEPEAARLGALIESLEAEIGILELDIQRLNREKACVCGKTVPFDARFCPDCGRRFEIPPESIIEAVEVEATLRCVRCDAELDAGDAFCLRCGADQRVDEE